MHKVKELANVVNKHKQIATLSIETTKRFTEIHVYTLWKITWCCYIA